MARSKKIDVPVEEDGYVPYCIIRFGYGAKLCMPLQQGVEIMAALGSCNVLKSDTWYESSKSVETLKPADADEITMLLITPAEMQFRQGNWEREQASKGK